MSWWPAQCRKQSKGREEIGSLETVSLMKRQSRDLRERGNRCQTSTNYQIQRPL